MCKSWSDFLRSLKKKEREENAMNRKMLAIGMTIGLCLSALSHPGPMPHPGPHRGPAPRPVPQIHRGPAPRPAPMPHHPHHHSSAWGRGGSNFWPGFVGGFVGSTLVRPSVVVIPPPPPPPGPYARQMWIEGHYEIQIVNGIYTQVWIPGRWVIVR